MMIFPLFFTCPFLLTASALSDNVLLHFVGYFKKHTRREVTNGWTDEDDGGFSLCLSLGFFCRVLNGGQSAVMTLSL